MDVSGIPFVVEERSDGLFAVGIKIRRRMIRFEGSGLPVDIVERLDGIPDNDKIDGLEEIEEFLDGQPEGSRLSDSIPDTFVSDDEVVNTWEEMLAEAKTKANKS